jgi:hypothetical protein
VPLTVTTVRSADRAHRELTAAVRTASKRAAPAARTAGASDTLTSTAVTGHLALSAWQT